MTESPPWTLPANPLPRSTPDQASERLFGLFTQRYGMAWDEQMLLTDLPDHDFGLNLAPGWVFDGHRIHFSICWSDLDVAPVTVYGPGLGAPQPEPMVD